MTLADELNDYLANAMAGQKRCPKCGEAKAVELFSLSRFKKGGRDGHGRACRSRYRTENKEAIAERKRRYRAENKEAIADVERRSRAKNRERVAERKRRYYAKNRERVAEVTRRYQAKHKDAIAAWRRRQISESDPAYLEQLLRKKGVPQERITSKIVKLESVRLSLYRAARTAQNHLKETRK